MTENEKRCPICNKIVEGRIDKVFCSIKCKNKQHNAYHENYYKLYKEACAELELFKSNKKIKQYQQKCKSQENLITQLTIINNDLTKEIEIANAQITRYEQTPKYEPEYYLNVLNQRDVLINENLKLKFKIDNLKQKIKKIQVVK